jgi:hypothetical protein
MYQRNACTDFKYHGKQKINTGVSVSQQNKNANQQQRAYTLRVC